MRYGPQSGGLPENSERHMDDNDMKAFLLVVRRALLMICAWIENRYNLRKPSEYDDR